MQNGHKEGYKLESASDSTERNLDAQVLYGHSLLNAYGEVLNEVLWPRIISASTLPVPELSEIPHGPAHHGVIKS